MGVLVERDFPILEALFRFRVLASGQLATICDRSSAVIRRRIRDVLVPLGYVRILKSGAAADQNAYALTALGLDLYCEKHGLNRKTLPFSARVPARPGTMHYRHHRLSCDVMIAFALASLGEDDPVQLVDMVPEWTMTTDILRRRSKQHSDRYLLSEDLPDLEHPGKMHEHRPDALIVLGVKDEPELRVGLFLEADRATEAIFRGPIMRKYEAYYHAWLTGVHRQHLAAPGISRFGFRVVFVVSNVRTSRRIGSMLLALRAFAEAKREWHDLYMETRPLEERLTIDEFVRCFRFCLHADFMEVREDGLAVDGDTRRPDIVFDPIWRSIESPLERAPLYRPLAAQEAA